MDDIGIISAYRRALGFNLPADKEKRRNALERAHDLRKFEIDLIWKRSTYFWGLQIAAFAGVGTIGAGVAKKCTECEPDLAFVTPGFLLLIAVFGFSSAVGWYCIAKASKVYMVNWEKHIDLLEKEFTGELYKTVFFRGPDGGPFLSITGINEANTVIAFALWSVIIFGASKIFAFQMHLSSLEHAFLIATIAMILAALSATAISRPNSISLVDVIPVKDGIFWRRRLTIEKQK